MKNVLIYLTLLAFSGSTVAQDLKFSQKPTLIYDANHKQAIIFKNDSVIIKTKQKKEVIIYKDDFPGSFSEYLYLNVGNRTIFVHEGCGPVLELRNDSLVRLDKSYLHRNQFRGNLFAYKNEIYFLGGYGLFTHKKILTKFNFENKEWDLVQTSDENIPTFYNCLSKVIDNHLYVFGGYIIKEEVANRNLYVLNLKTKEWKIYKSTIYSNFGQLSQLRNNIIENESGFLLIGNETIYIDLRENLIKKI